MNAKYIREHLEHTMDSGAVHILNQYEYFSAAMMSGLADEELAFTPLASIYCRTMEDLYVPLCYVRKNGNNDSFSNSIALYEVWKPRLEKYKLEKDKEKLTEEISKIESKSIPSVWDAK